MLETRAPDQSSQSSASRCLAGMRQKTASTSAALGGLICSSSSRGSLIERSRTSDGVVRDLREELLELLADGEWWTFDSPVRNRTPVWVARLRSSTERAMIRP